MTVVETPETGKSLSSNDAIRSLIKEERLNNMRLIETPEDSISMSRNEAVRFLLRRYNLKLWQLADAMEVSEATITRMMRHEISDETFNKICSLIRDMRDNHQEAHKNE